MFAIEINHLTKKFGEVSSIEDVHLQIEKGEVFGFLGPNGSGKSTTIRHLMGFLNATSGNCRMNNLDCRKNAATIQQFVGYLPGEIAFMDKMTGIRFIQFIAQLRGLKDLTRAHELIEYFELDSTKLIHKMSKGMKQKVGLVCAFMHEPEIVVLDEPTSGLDPLMQTKFVEFILEEKKKGTTIFMSSHMIEEVEKTCDRVAIINAGKIVAIDEVSELKKRKTKRFLIEFANDIEVERFLQESFEMEQVTNKQVSIRVYGNVQKLLSTLGHYEISDLDIASQSLEDIFMDYYQTGGKSS